jgi:hypothetical protein
MRMIVELEHQAHGSEVGAVTTYQGHTISCRVVYTEVHKYRASYYREYWLDGVRIGLLQIQEKICGKG